MGEERFRSIRHIRILIPLAVLALGLPAWGTQEEPNRLATNFIDMSLEELLTVPVVVSSSRQEQRITETSVPTSVITAEDIHYSGLTNIAEVLQFTPGVDVLRADRNRYAVGVRGLHETVSDRVLSLVDGRVADNPLYGGPEFTRIPVFLEDIERIEVVRGPGGAAWGANAFTGVINIITKDPADVLGYFGSTTMNEFGDSFTHVRWADKKNRWRWRFSAGYEELESSDDAGAGRLESPYDPATRSMIGFDQYVVRDFSRTCQFDAKAIYEVCDQTDLSLGAGYSHIESGDYEQIGYFPRKDNRDERLRTFARIDHDFENGSTGYLQWSDNLTQMNWRSLMIVDAQDNDLEGQYSFQPTQDHQMSIGGNLRWVRLNTSRDTAEQVLFRDEPFDEYWAGLFAIDRWQVTERLTIEGQLRGDWYSQTQTDWSGRLAGLYALDQDKEHIFRISTAKAFRTPLISLRELEVHHFPAGGGLYVVNVNPTEDLKNEQTWSVEAGYSGRVVPGLTLFANTYYQRFEHLIGYVVTTDTFGLFQEAPVNLDGADSWGAEIELALEGKAGKLSGWYAYNDFSYSESLRSLQPARHKTGVSARWFINDNWTLNGNYKFTDTTQDNPFYQYTYAAFHRLDLTISRKVANGHGELMFGVSDLLNETNDPLFETPNYAAHETPGRTFFARLQLNF